MQALSPARDGFQPNGLAPGDGIHYREASDWPSIQLEPQTTRLWLKLFVQVAGRGQVADGIAGSRSEAHLRGLGCV